MNRNAKIELAVCGACLVGLSLLARHLEPALGTAALFIAVAGGVLCVVWRAVAWRAGAIVTLAAVAGVLAWEALRLWQASMDATGEHRSAAVLMTVLVVFCVGTLAHVVQRAGDGRGDDGHANGNGSD